MSNWLGQLTLIIIISITISEININKLNNEMHSTENRFNFHHLIEVKIPTDKQNVSFQILYFGNEQQPLLLQ